MKSKQLALTLLLAFLPASLNTACTNGGTQNPPPSATDDESVTTPLETTPEYDYPEADFEGHEFVFLNQAQCSWANRLVAPEELNGDLINDAMFERNSRIEKRYNITISDYCVTKEEIPTLVRNTVNSSDDAYDVALFPIDNASALMIDGYFVDLLTVDSLNLDKPWWDNTVVESATLKDHCYLASSDITFFPFEATWVIYFNEDRFDDLKIDQPYELVRDGKWTIDKLTEFSTAGASLNGQDSFAYNESSNVADYGIITHDQVVQALIFGAGETFFDTSSDTPKFSGESERIYSACEKIAKLVGVDGVSLDRDKAGGKDTDEKSFCRSAFKTGHFMFMSETLGHIAGLRDFEGNFGVLPMPKYDDAQDSYYSMVATWGTLMTTIPMSSKDPERTGVILDALAYDSYKNLMEPYYDTYLTSKGARNEDSADMLKIVRDTRILNIGQMYGWSGSMLSSIASTLEKGGSSVSSIVASNKSSIEAKIADTIDKMQ